MSQFVLFQAQEDIFHNFTGSLVRKRERVSKWKWFCCRVYFDLFLLVGLHCMGKNHRFEMEKFGAFGEVFVEKNATRKERKKNTYTEFIPNCILERVRNGENVAI